MIVRKSILPLIIGTMILAVVEPAIACPAELASPLLGAAPTMRGYTVAIGVVGGLTKAIHHSGFQSVANDVLCPDFTDGVGYGYHWGISSEWLMTRNDAWNRSLVVRLQYNTLPGHYQVPGDTLPSLGTHGNIIYSEVAHVADIDYSVVEAVVLYKQNLFGSNLGLVVGPSIGYVTTSRLEQRMEIVSPDSSRFERVDEQAEYSADMRKLITARTDMEGRSDIRLGISLGVQYEIFFDDFQIVPGIQYNVSLGSVDVNTNLNINAVLASIDVRYTF